MRLHIILTGLTSVFLAGTAIAEGIPIDPGQWEMTSTMTMTMMPQPRTHTSSECIEEDELNPEDFDMDKDNPCTIEDITFEGDTARWSINCPTKEGLAMEGHWEMTSHGDTLTGKGMMSAEIAGQKMGFDMTWEGERVGDCE